MHLVTNHRLYGKNIADERTLYACFQPEVQRHADRLVGLNSSGNPGQCQSPDAVTEEIVQVAKPLVPKGASYSSWLYVCRMLQPMKRIAGMMNTMFGQGEQQNKPRVLPNLSQTRLAFVHQCRRSGFLTPRRNVPHQEPVNAAGEALENGASGWISQTGHVRWKAMVDSVIDGKFAYTPPAGRYLLTRDEKSEMDRINATSSTETGDEGGSDSELDSEDEEAMDEAEDAARAAAAHAV